MNNILHIFKIPELRNKILIVAGLLLVFRVLAVIPVPGVDALNLERFLGQSQLFGFLNIFSGGALANLSIVMIGLAPYITATIIMQLLTMIFPSLKAMYYEEGSAGRAKFNRYSRYLTIPLAILQAYGFLNLLMSQSILPRLGAFDLVTNIAVITAGSMILVWLGELITEQKIGNGISLLIFAGIVSSLPGIVQQFFLNPDSSMLPTYITFVIVAVLVTAFVVFIQEGERKIPIAYAKQVRGTRMYGGASSYLPLKVNQAGVIPIIFAISILLFPQFFAQAVAIFSQPLSLTLTDWVNRFFNNQYAYAALYFVLVVVFTYFYTAVTFDPKEIAKNLQRAGGFIAGIRPGESTATFLANIINRITFSGALFLGLIAILPNITQMVTGFQSLTLGGTALLIVVAVALEVTRQINAQLTVREYEGIR